MRLFVAIELDPGVKKALSETAGLLIKQVCRANLTRLENLHITLAFIGETDRVDEIKKELDRVSGKSFDIEVDGFGRFGDLFYVNIEKKQELTALAGKVRSVLTGIGIIIDNKPFVPHITLARKIVCAREPVLSVERIKIPVKSFMLMKSERIGGKLIYTKIYEKYLG